nr:serine hydrolase [Nesterenkonia sp. Act20]
MRFAVGAGASAGTLAQSHADQPHELAGIGKLILGLTFAHLGEGEEGLMEHQVTVTSEHRQGARTGTLRQMSGDLELSVNDALNLVFSTGDGACVLALLELATSAGVDLLAEAQPVLATLGLDAITLTGLEQEQSWGEGLLGQTTASSTLQLLHALGTPDSAEDLVDLGVSSAIRTRIHGWMSKVFEPAGLASALPGFGPQRVPHQTLSGLELTAYGAEHGFSSVLTLPNQAGEWVHVAAHLPPSSAGVRSPREISAVLGTLGLAAYRLTGD